MTGLTRLVTVCALVATALVSNAQVPIINRSQGLVLGEFNGDAIPVSETQNNRGYTVQFNGLNSLMVVVLRNPIAISQYSHVTMRLTNYAADLAQLEFSVRSQGGQGWLASRFALAPGESINVAVPFRAANSIGLRALPPFADSTRHQTASNGDIDLESVESFFLWNKGLKPVKIGVEEMQVEMHSIRLTEFVDTYGQTRAYPWNGKVTSDTDLRLSRRFDPVTDAFAFTADNYGGVYGKNYGTTPRFRLQKDAGRWYYVTPAGNRFFSLGVNEVGGQAFTPVDGRRAMFTDLDNLQARFPLQFYAKEGRLGFTPYFINLERKYGAHWVPLSEDVFVKRMKAWGLNSLGVNSSNNLVKGKRLPSTFGGEIEGPHARFAVYDGGRLHDVWDPFFRTSCRRTVNERLINTGGNHESSLGIFIDNELPWGDRNRTDDPARRYPVAVGALNAAPTSASHQQFLNQLIVKYTTIQALNTAWGTAYPSWQSLDSQNVQIPATLTSAANADFLEFTRFYAARYFGTVRQAIRDLGYVGPYLGCRFTAETPQEIIDVAKQYVDVLSFNVYNPHPSIIIGHVKNIDFPVIISEVAFGANENGRVGVPYFATLTESGRGQAWKEFMVDVKTWNNLVGVHWYRWEDLPATGTLVGDNAALGLNSITDVPYASFVDQLRVSSIDYMNWMRNQASEQDNKKRMPGVKG